MCKAFSCIVGADRSVTWKLGVDSHTELLGLTSYKDDTADPAKMQFARVEVTPDNRNYLFPDAWTLRVDQSIRPAWFGPKHEEAAMGAHRQWLKKLDKVLIRKEIVHPFKLTPPAITDEHRRLLKQWASVRDSVWDSVRDSVGASVRDSVRDSVGDSVWDSVWDSVGASVGDSVWAYAGSFFHLPKWQHIEHPRGQYPFQSLVTLWEQGLVPSFDGKVWRLHGGPKAEVLFYISAEELRGGS